MNTVLITLQVFLVLILILLVFLQKSNDEGIANLATTSSNAGKKKSASTISKITTFVAAIFMINSLIMAKITKMAHDEHKKLVQDVMDIDKQQPNNTEEEPKSDFDLLLNTNPTAKKGLQNKKSTTQDTNTQKGRAK